MGIWLPKRGKNLPLVRELRAAWKTCCVRRGINTVKIKHVRSHTGVPGNELVDRLASMAAIPAPDEPDLSLQDAVQIMDEIEEEGRKEEGGGRGNEGNGQGNGGGGGQGRATRRISRIVRQLGTHT